MVSKVFIAATACWLLAACASGLPDPTVLQSSLSGQATATGAAAPATTASTTTGQRSLASRVLAAVAVERVLGHQPDQAGLWQ